jgi:histidine triad (HIT) family protein
MSSDFYCNEVLSGRTAVQIVAETENVLAFHHTRPYIRPGSTLSSCSRW